jgi:hypothetical protein
MNTCILNKLAFCDFSGFKIAKCRPPSTKDILANRIRVVLRTILIMIIMSNKIQPKHNDFCFHFVFTISVLIPYFVFLYAISLTHPWGNRDGLNSSKARSYNIRIQISLRMSNH